MMNDEPMTLEEISKKINNIIEEGKKNDCCKHFEESLTTLKEAQHHMNKLVQLFENATPEELEEFDKELENYYYDEKMHVNLLKE